MVKSLAKRQNPVHWGMISKIVTGDWMIVEMLRIDWEIRRFAECQDGN
ncbi:MAG: hypothetical protein ABJZ55_14055 [Fuerstiella sp.]